VVATVDARWRRAGRCAVFGDFVLQTLFCRRQAIERLRSGIQMVGSWFNRNTHRLRELTARNRVHDGRDVDEPRAKRAAPTAIAIDSSIVIRRARSAKNELARAIGVAHSPVSGAATQQTLASVLRTAAQQQRDPLALLVALQRSPHPIVADLTLP
jgi:hypothetical protein